MQKLFPKPTQVETALVGLNPVQDAMDLYAMARCNCSDLLSAFEIILRPGLELALVNRSDLRDPLKNPYRVFILLELPCGAGINLCVVLENCLADAGEVLVDGVIAMNHAQAEGLWACRETMVEARVRRGLLSD